ncbi:MAG TPA: filament integrity protein FraC [Leptolyngbyaceae cyanobacterium]
MPIAVLPLRAVMFQILFLLVAIAVESFIFKKKLHLSGRTSIEYATSINLFSTIIGWIAFFFFLPFLPFKLQAQLINFILFNNFATHLGFSLLRVYLDLVLFALLTFILIICLEVFALEFLINLNKFSLRSTIENQRETENYRAKHSPKTVLDSNKSNSILTANVYSQTFILLILFLIQRFSYLNPK